MDIEVSISEIIVLLVIAAGIAAVVFAAKRGSTGTDSDSASKKPEPPVEKKQ